MEKFKILDLFCGAGGLSLGLEQTGQMQTILGVDFNRDALLTFKHNFPHAQVIHGDIKNKKIKDKIYETCRKNGINMIVGGPSCQGFSLKGKNLGLNDERNFLFKEYLEIVKKVKPKIFLIENVKNLLNSANGYFKNEILSEIEKLGYKVTWKVLNAVDYGVPQHRERAFFIACKEKRIGFPEKRQIFVTVKDAISDLSYLNSGEGQIESEYKMEAQSNYQKLMRSKKLQYHQASSHSDEALRKLKMIPPEKGKEFLPKELLGKQKFSTTWGRLVWNDVSPTIDTRFDTPSNGKNSHPKLHRAITPREAARLQSFPDSFEFIGKKCAVCKQIGNAVPPLLAKAIGEKILESLNLTTDQTDNLSIYHYDALLKIKDMIDKNQLVDHIITDPPYNISKRNNFSTMTSAKRIGIDFGEWDKEFDLFSWIPDCVKLLKKNGSFIIFGSYRYISFMIKTLENNGMEVKDVIIWQKTNPMPRNTERRYVQDMEFAIWAVKQNSKWTFNKLKNEKYMRSIFETSIVAGKEKTQHPTQKSLKLMERLIEIHTNKNDQILDPFMGSGTTGVACLNKNRRFVGIEINDLFYKIARDRLYKTINMN